MPFNVIAFPSQSEERNLFEVQIPAVLSILVTHSLDKTVPSVAELQEEAKERIQNGIPAVLAMEQLGKNPNDTEALAQFEAHKEDVGYGLLLQKYAPEGDVTKATDKEIELAAKDTIPEVWVIFWAFRVMVVLGLLMLAYFVTAIVLTLRNTVQNSRWFLRASVWMIPVPFVACEVGWIVAEMGRQPWTVFEVLPTWISASTHSVTYMVVSLIGFVLLYTAFAIVELYLMVRSIRKGPDAPSELELQQLGKASAHGQLSTQ